MGVDGKSLNVHLIPSETRTVLYVTPFCVLPMHQKVDKHDDQMSTQGRDTHWRCPIWQGSRHAGGLGGHKPVSSANLVQATGRLDFVIIGGRCPVSQLAPSASWPQLAETGV